MNSLLLIGFLSTANQDFYPRGRLLINQASDPFKVKQRRSFRLGIIFGLFWFLLFCATPAYFAAAKDDLSFLWMTIFYVVPQSLPLYME